MNHNGRVYSNLGELARAWRIKPVGRPHAVPSRQSRLASRLQRRMIKPKMGSGNKLSYWK